MLTIFLDAIVLIILIAVGVYWLVARACGNEPHSEVMDESIEMKRSRGEHVDA